MTSIVLSQSQKLGFGLLHCNIMTSTWLSQNWQTVMVFVTLIEEWHLS
jgi:hypothetical protein